MNQVRIDSVDFTDLDLPETIYKYRVWTNPYHKTIISKKEVFMASPRLFIDPLDCKIPIRYDLLSKKDLFEKYLYESRKDHPKWTREQHRKFARTWMTETAMSDFSFVKEWQESYFEDFFDRFGVFSLTANCFNDRMWKVYSDNHKGFCVGFNTLILFGHLGGGGNVNYVDELPIIFPSPKHSYEYQHALLVFSKLRKWEYEQEYRTHKFYKLPPTETERIIQVPASAYKELILGKNMEPKIKEDLLKSIPPDLATMTIKDEE